MAHTVSIRQSLLRDLLLVILLLSGGILATTVFAARQTIEILSRAYMGKAIDATNARLAGFFAPVRRELRMLGAWGEAGLLDTDDPAALNRLLGAEPPAGPAAAAPSPDHLPDGGRRPRARVPAAAQRRALAQSHHAA
jgi:hypothetical protein